MSLDVISNISLDQKVMNTVGSDGTVVGVVNGTISDVGTIHGSTQMKVDGIATESECLTTVAYLCVLNSAVELDHTNYTSIYCPIST